MAKTKNILGLAFEERRILAAEVSMQTDRPQLVRQGVFETAGGIEDADAVQVGQQLRQFLRAGQFTARTAVVGLPGRWIVAKQVKIPPADDEALPGIVQIQVQRSFSLDAQDLAFDFYRRREVDASSTLLLMATQNRRLSQIALLVRAAGLRITAVTPTSHAIRVFERSGVDLGIYLSDDGVEFWSGKADLPWIRHVWRPKAADEQQDRLLQEEVRRQLAMTARDGEAGQRRLTIYTSQEPAEASLQRAADAMSGPDTIVDGHTTLFEGGLGGADVSQAGRTVGAAALALAGCTGKAFYVDFVNSHSAAKKRSPRVRVRRWAAILGGAAVIALIAVVVGWRRDVRDIATYTQQLDAMSSDIAAARQVVDRMSHAATWTVRRPHFLDCLHALTGAFPDEGSVWVVSLAVRENKQGLITGQALRESNVLGVLDALKGNPAFGEVAMVYMRDAGRTTNEVSFAISFKYLAMD
ncbi:MAG: hypothetical protein IH624_06885 [Phycisphaerae bacterium]|nr:hypothetical protein [Phycisphaerae bacterium]